MVSIVFKTLLRAEYPSLKKDLNTLNAKEQATLVRIAAGKNGKDILTPEEFEFAMNLWKSRDQSK